MPRPRMSAIVVGAATLALGAPTVPAAATTASALPMAFAVQPDDAALPEWAGSCTPSISNCWGLDPTATAIRANGPTCSSDAVTLGSGTPDGVQMQIRYSSGCGAVWVKVFNLPNGWDFYVQDGYGNKLYWSSTGYEGFSAGSDDAYTGMVDGSRMPVKGCFLNNQCITS